MTMLGYQNHRLSLLIRPSCIYSSSLSSLFYFFLLVRQSEFTLLVERFLDSVALVSAIALRYLVACFSKLLRS